MWTTKYTGEFRDENMGFFSVECDRLIRTWIMKAEETHLKKISLGSNNDSTMEEIAEHAKTINQ